MRNALFVLGMAFAGLLGCGQGSSATPSTTLPPPPVATFTLQPATGTAPLSVTFSNGSTGTITSQTWMFGDGAFSAEVSPTHTFATAGTYPVQLSVQGPGGSSTSTKQVTVAAPSGQAWRFAVVGDTHVPGATALADMVPALLAEGVDLVLVPGDLVQGGAGASASTLASQLATWKGLMEPLRAAGIGIYAVRGNHEADVPQGLAAWQAAFSGSWQFPANGPTGESNLSYTFTHQNALFIGLDQYVNLHHVNQTWLASALAAHSSRPHVFVFGHEPAFKAFHTDCLDEDVPARDAFWKALGSAGAKTYLCGHDHFLDLARIEDGDGQPSNDLVQVVVGTGGGDPFDRFQYNGANGAFTPVNLTHAVAQGYLLVEIGGAGSTDLGATLTFKERQTASDGSVRFVATHRYAYDASPAQGTYPIVGTGLTACFGAVAEIPTPAPGEPFYGQDAQHPGRAASYQDQGDGTVTDLVTGLMWVQARGAKLTWEQAAAGAALCRTGGHADWRMPTIKELYSLIRFTGAQGTSMTSTAGYVPFLDATVFGFAFGAGTASERIIDCQDWSATRYVGQVMTGQDAAFGVNFADGRIKGYPLTKTNYVRYVRGNPSYGVNDFHDNGDGTVTDQATGLMWAQDDSGVGLDWQSALAWVQARNAVRHLDHADWRLPSAKELQSLLDYTRAPMALDVTRRGPAIDPIFRCTTIVNEGGASDAGFYWTGTSFRDGTPDGVPAAYLCFGRALGWMQIQGGTTYQLLDVHGAGAQRSDPKAGQVTEYRLGVDASGKPVYGRGPQGDVVRIQNLVRLVRNAD